MTTARLTAVVETKGVQKANSDLNKFIKSANDADKKTGKLGKSFKSFGRNASASIAAIDGPLGGISSRVTALTTVVNSGTLAFTALGVGITAASAALIVGTLELDKQNIALKSTEALLKATGNAAGVTALQLEDEARAIALNTLASVDGIRQAQNIFLTFNRVQGDVRADAVALSQDLAQVFGGTAASQATQLGKALQDPIKGITALTRVGVTFTEQQKEQIKTLQDSGDILSAQGIILDELKGQVGGVAAAVSSGTLAGGYDEFIQRIQETSRSIADSSGSYDLTLSFFGKLNGLLEKVNYSFSDKAVVNDAIGNVSKLRDQYILIEERIEKLNRLGFVSKLVVDQEKVRLKEVQALMDEQNAIIDKFYQNKEKQREDENLAQKQSAAKQLELTKASAQSDLDALFKRGLSKQQLINQQENEELEKFSQANAKKLGLEMEYARARAEIRKTAADQRAVFAQKEIDAQAKIDEKLQADKDKAREKLESDKATAQEKLDFFVQLNNTELEEVDRVESERLAIIQTYLDQGLTNKQAAIDAEIAIQADAMRQRIDIADEEAKERDRIDKETRQMRVDTALGVLNDLAAIGGRESKIFKATAKVNALIKTYEAANSAYASLAPIPIVGPALGAAAAGVAIAAGVANVRAIDSAREQGGTLAAGQSSTVAERGLEILTPANASRVRTANDMRNIMGESNGKPEVNIVVINQSEGNNTVEQSTDDEGRIILLIRKTVSGDIADPNSQTSKSLGANTTAQRRRA